MQVAVNDIYPTVCTLWRKDGEVNREASWTKKYIACHIEETRGEVRTANGNAATGTSTIIAKVSDIKAGDKIERGEIIGYKPTANALTVESVSWLMLYGRFHHSEVIAK